MFENACNWLGKNNCIDRVWRQNKILSRNYGFIFCRIDNLEPILLIMERTVEHFQMKGNIKEKPRSGRTANEGISMDVLLTVYANTHWF